MTQKERKEKLGRAIHKKMDAFVCELEKRYPSMTNKDVAFLMLAYSVGYNVDSALEAYKKKLKK